jgi:SAM-dependent methyltransferase
MSVPPPRVAIIQAELDRFDKPRYLEVGIFDGLVFLQIRAATKVAVDPRIRMSWWRRWREGRRAGVSFHEMPSDDFFRDLGDQEGFDVVFVDGLHLYEQALRDAENALARLAPGGVVLMHDCNPTAAAVADRNPEVAFENGHRAWCGDVWKAIVAWFAEAETTKSWASTPRRSRGCRTKISRRTAVGSWG